MSVAGTVKLKDEYLQVANYKDGPSNPFYNLDGMKDFYFVYDENMSQVALEKIFKALYAANNPGRLAELTGIIYGNGGNDKGLIGTLEDAARLVNEKKAIFEDYEKVMTQIDNIQSEYSIASQQFEMVMIDLIGDKETWTSSETGGLLGALRSNFVELQKTYPSGTDNNNYLAIDRSITDIDTIIKALKGSQGKNGNWTDTTTIITFSTRWTSEVSSALNRLFSISCDGDSADEVAKFDFAISTVPEAYRPKGDNGVPVLTKDGAVYTWGDIIFLREETYTWTGNFIKDYISEEYLVDCINKLPGTSYYNNDRWGLNGGQENANDYYRQLNDRTYQKEDGKWYYDDSRPFPSSTDDHFKPDYDRGKGFDTREECFKRMAKATWAGRCLFWEVYLPNNRNEVVAAPNSTALRDKMWDWITNKSNTSAKVDAVRTHVLNNSLTTSQKEILNDRFDLRNKSILEKMDSTGYAGNVVKQIERAIYSDYDKTQNTRPNKKDEWNFQRNGISGLMYLADIYNNAPSKVAALKTGTAGGKNVTFFSIDVKEFAHIETAKNELGKKMYEGDTSVEAGVDTAYASYSTVYEQYKKQKAEYDLLMGSDINELLDLVLRYGDFDGGESRQKTEGAVYRITQITRDLNGNYTAVKSTTPEKAKSAVNAQDAMKNLAIPYYSLTVCLEKANIVRDVMVAQVQILQDINDAIERNNEYLKDANKCYEKYYQKCITNKRYDSFTHQSSAGLDLASYVTRECNYEFDPKNYTAGKYNKEGTSSTSNGFTNIDVEEQGNLTKISNAQEAIRMKGDELNTSSQMATTKLQQYTQNYNSSISIASQLAKSVGENFKNIASNVR